MMPKNKRLKILYIAGWGRSGSTIIDNILGQLDGFFSGGEISYIWERGFQENRKCGCGQKFNDCVVWQNIVHKALGDKNDFDAKSLENMTFRYTRTMRIFWLIATHGGSKKSVQFRKYLEILERLYLGIAQETKSWILIDSSKFPVYGAILFLLQSFDVYVLHLVRDPRAVAHSWMTSKLASDSDEQTYLPKINPISSAVWWNGWNLAIEYLGYLYPARYLKMNYEKFSSSPRSSIEKILNFLGEARLGTPFKNDSTVTLSENHTVTGNPNRFLQGDIDIKPDMRWLSDMSLLNKIIVTLIALPFLRHFNREG